MTIKDAKIRLLDFFKTHESYTNKNFKDIIPISQNEVLDVLILNSALEELSESKIVKKITIFKSHPKASELKEEYVTWVLTQPLSDYSQQVEISANTAFGISVLFNKFCESKKVDDRMNPLAITEKNIQDVLFILNELMIKTGIIKEESDR